MKRKLEIDSVQVSFGDHRVLSDVYLSCTTGRVTGLLGRNGSGKSTLFRLLFGELNGQARSIRLDGEILPGRRRDPRVMRYLPQRHFVPEYLPIRRVLQDFGCTPEALLEAFPHMASDLDHKVHQLSSGWRRILELFIILKAPADFCLLDEPFSQVMPLHIEVIRRIIQEEKQRKGFLISDHMYRHVLALSDDLYVLRDGKTHPAQGMEDLARLGYVNLYTRN